MSRFTIYDLAATIDARAASGGEASYTRKLLDKGAEHCAKKLGEEAVETVIAAIEDDRLISERQDLLRLLFDDDHRQARAAEFAQSGQQFIDDDRR